jgi:hypothetical protein
MKKLFLHITLLFSIVVFSQNDNPTITKNGVLPQDFVPKNWKIIKTEKGDLNNDKLEDMVLVIENTDKKYMLQNDGMGMPSLNTNPRYLLIIFKNKTNKNYDLVAVNKKFIPSENDEESRCLSDPLLQDGDLSIRKGVLNIELNYWLSCGSYGVTHNTYRLRFQKNKFELIGYDTKGMSRSSGEEDMESINFMTKKKCNTTGGNAFEEDIKKVKTVCKSIKISKIIKLENLTKDTEMNY